MPTIQYIANDDGTAIKRIDIPLTAEELRAIREEEATKTQASIDNLAILDAVLAQVDEINPT